MHCKNGKEVTLQGGYFRCGCCPLPFEVEQQRMKAEDPLKYSLLFGPMPRDAKPVRSARPVVARITNASGYNFPRGGVYRFGR
mgnify:CR=1 FL=1